MYSSRPIPPARPASPGERRGIPVLDQSRRYGDGQGVFECEQLAGWLCDVLDALANGEFFLTCSFQFLPLSAQ
ncbi:hypothetical protein Pstu14405_15510 [Stutzerimonas stutzeri]|nr:hypothetical protein Pstu14405_15510 [Stutzerimonas stutzeri]